MQVRVARKFSLWVVLLLLVSVISFRVCRGKRSSATGFLFAALNVHCAERKSSAVCCSLLLAYNQVGDLMLFVIGVALHLLYQQPAAQTLSLVLVA